LKVIIFYIYIQYEKSGNIGEKKVFVIEKYYLRVKVLHSCFDFAHAADHPLVCS